MLVEEKYYDTVWREDSFAFEEIDGLTERTEFPCKLFADQASNTGIAIFDNAGNLVLTSFINRESTETPTQFKLLLEDYLSGVIKRFNVDKMYNEDVFVGKSITTFETLVIIKQSFSDIAEKLSIPLESLNNQMWKTLLASPSSWSKSIDDKSQIKHYVNRYFPNINEPQDVLDAIGMGIAIHVKKSNKKVLNYKRPYNKRLSAVTDVLVLTNLEDLHQSIYKSKFGKKAIKTTIKYFNFLDKEDLEINSKRFLSENDCVGVCLIPENKNLGQLFIKYSIKPSSIPKNAVLIGVCMRK